MMMLPICVIKKKKENKIIKLEVGKNHHDYLWKLVAVYKMIKGKLKVMEADTDIWKVQHAC